ATVPPLSHNLISPQRPLSPTGNTIVVLSQKHCIKHLSRHRTTAPLGTGDSTGTGRFHWNWTIPLELDDSTGTGRFHWNWTDITLPAQLLFRSNARSPNPGAQRRADGGSAS
ncbi:hypothetical protein E4U60_005739, partial [Claviceps pazoutovae]